MYRILWHDPDRNRLSEATYRTVTEAEKIAKRTQRAYVRKTPPGYDLTWASGRILPDWYRQICLELGE